MFHQKHYLLLLFFAGIIQAITVPANIDKAKIDSVENLVSGPHYPFVPMSTIIVADSSAGEYTMWTQVQECLAYNPGLGYLQFVCRNFNISGNLDVFQTDNQFSFYVTDPGVYAQDFGPARYPTSVASDSPHISFSYLISGAWGGMGGQYESGGWFSSFWDLPVDVGTGNLGTYKNIGKQLANGNILFISLDLNDNILFSTYSPDLSTRIAGGIVAPATAHYWGFDYNNGIAYLFYYDDSLYYKTTTDGITWSAQQSWNVVWPNPYPSNIIGWTQAVVTDAGNPILIFDNWNGAGVGRKVYVSIASGTPCIEVGDTTTDAISFYPTIAAGGNYVVALFSHWRSGTGQYTFWDVYYNYSTDNGATWSTPRSLTSNITDHNNCLPQISKRLDATNGQFFFAFGNAISDPLLDLYWNIMNSGPSAPSRWYVGRNPVVGIAENRTETPKRLSLNIAPNPVHEDVAINYAIPKPGNVSVQIYSVDGRFIQTLDNGYHQTGNYTIRINTKHLASGTYIVILKTKTGDATRPAIVIH